MTLRAECGGDARESLRISGASGGDALAVSEIGLGAAAHGKSLLDCGYTVDQVVHDYGDLCQAITDLAVERDAPFSIDEFRTLNRCLDNAIADAVTGFAQQRDEFMAFKASVDANQRLGFLVHELRNHLQTATIAFSALEAGKLAIGGSTAGLVKRSLASLSALLTESIAHVRQGAAHAADEIFSIKSLIADAAGMGALYARASDCTLTVSMVEPELAVSGNRVLLAAAVGNLLQNAFKFTHPRSTVTLSAHGDGDRILIAVRDQCGGLPVGAAENLFKPFKQVGADRTGLGLGLSIARRSIEAEWRIVGGRRPPWGRMHLHDRFATKDVSRSALIVVVDDVRRPRLNTDARHVPRDGCMSPAPFDRRAARSTARSRSACRVHVRNAGGQCRVHSVSAKLPDRVPVIYRRVNRYWTVSSTASVVA